MSASATYATRPIKDISSLTKVEVKFTERQMAVLEAVAARRECSVSQLIQETVECEVINLRSHNEIESQNGEIVKASLYGCSLRDCED